MITATEIYQLTTVNSPTLGFAADGAEYDGDATVE